MNSLSKGVKRIRKGNINRPKPKPKTEESLMLSLVSLIIVDVARCQIFKNNQLETSTLGFGGFLLTLLLPWLNQWMKLLLDFIFHMNTLYYDCFHQNLLEIFKFIFDRFPYSPPG